MDTIRSFFGSDYRPFYARFLEDLPAARQGHIKARCRFHEDQNPSLSIDLQRGLFKCHGCGAQGDIFDFFARARGLNGNFRAALNGIAEEFGIPVDTRESTTPGNRIVATYDYTDASGTLRYQVVRSEPKIFRQRRPDGKGGWIWNMQGVERVLYRLSELPAASEVWVVEGEKDANSLGALGIVATCNVGGAGKWLPAYSEALAGKCVVIVPDQDEPGRKHGELVARSLHGRVRSLRVVNVPVGKDVSDFIAAQVSKQAAADRLAELVEQAAEWTLTPAAEEKPASSIRVIDAAEYLRTAPPEPDQIIQDVFDAGDKLAILASSKLRKSFFTLMLSLALAIGNGFLKWCTIRPRRVLYVQFEIREAHCHRRTLNLARAMGIAADDLAGRLKIISGRGLGLAGAEGLERIIAAAGEFKPEVIVLDPLYKLAQGVENAAEDFKVILGAFDRIAEQSGAAVVFVHHDAKGAPGDKDIRDRGAGSGVLGRDYDACIALTAHATEPDATVVETLLRNYPPQDPFTVSWECTTDGGYCFVIADDVHPEKRTSACKPAPPPLSSYLSVAKEILIAGREVEFSFFRAEFKQRTNLSDHRIRDFVSWATGGENPQLTTREERARGLRKKWVRLAETNQ